MLKEKDAEDKKKKNISKQNKNKIRKIESSSEESDLEVEYAESDCSYVDETDILEDEDHENVIPPKKSSKLIVSRRKPLTEAKNDISCDTEVLLSSNIQNAKQKASLTLGCYVIVIYENEYFPGRVENIDENQCEVSTMVLSSGNTFRWPEKTDKIWYNYDQVIAKIDDPVCVNKRGFYKIKEMEKYLPNIYS